MDDKARIHARVDPEVKTAAQKKLLDLKRDGINLDLQDVVESLLDGWVSGTIPQEAGLKQEAQRAS